MEMNEFYDSSIVDFVRVAKNQGWDVMVKDVYNFVNNYCVSDNNEEKHELAKIVLNDVGYELTKILTKK